MPIFRIILALLIASLAGCAEIPDRKQPPTQLGVAAPNPFALGSNQVPLPGGDWILVATDVRTVDMGGPYSFDRGLKTKNGGVVLAEMQDGILNRLVQIRTVIKGPYDLWSWFKVKACGRTDLHYRHTFENREWGAQDCWWVSHEEVFLTDDASPLWQAALAYFETHRIRTPNFMMSVGYRFANRGRHSNFLNVVYYWNPELQDLPPAERTSWLQSEWHSSRIIGDPATQGYVEALKRWAARWHDIVKAGFDALAVNPLQGECSDGRATGYGSSDCVEWRKAYEG